MPWRAISSEVFRGPHRSLLLWLVLDSTGPMRVSAAKIDTRGRLLQAA